LCHFGEKEIAMLVLTRKLDEAIQIGDNIKITVLRVKGNTVRIGIEAPKHVKVIRDELERVIASDLLASPASTASSSYVSPVNRIDSYVDQSQNVVTAVVDSPEPSSTRMFIGKFSVSTGKSELKEVDPTDQAAPLRAFLKTGRTMQIAS
jgi:carbon storage regulator CsrA